MKSMIQLALAFTTALLLNRQVQSSEVILSAAGGSVSLESPDIRDSNSSQWAEEAEYSSATDMISKFFIPDDKENVTRDDADLRLKGGKPSHTAMMAAMCHVVIGTDLFSYHLVPEGSAQVQRDMLEASGIPVPSDFVGLFLSPFLGLLLSAVVHPYALSYVAARKTFFDEQTRNAIEGHGIRQVVAVGAGFDALSFRMSQEYKDVAFWEVDHPSTARVKAVGLKTMTNGADISPTSDSNLRQIQVDLAENKLSHVLRSVERYQDNQKTLFVVEGVTFYLSEEDVKGLLQEIAKVAPAGSIVAFDFVDWHTSQEQPKLGWMDWQNEFIMGRLKKRGEPMKWGISPEDIDDFMGPEWRPLQPVKIAGFEHMMAAELV